VCPLPLTSMTAFCGCFGGLGMSTRTTLTPNCAASLGSRGAGSYRAVQTLCVARKAVCRGRHHSPEALPCRPSERRWFPLRSAAGVNICQSGPLNPDDSVDFRRLSYLNSARKGFVLDGSWTVVDAIGRSISPYFLQWRKVSSRPSCRRNGHL
jgi:hypothetical protein